MFGAEIAVGYVFAWAVRKLRRVAGPADQLVDEALDATVERVYDVVTARLGGERALARVEEEAQSGAAELSPANRQLLQLTLEDEARRDDGFAAQLAEAVEAAQAAEAQHGPLVATGKGIVVGGNVDIKAEDGSMAALQMGDVHFNAPPKPTAT
ncbi:chromosome partitioning protein [Actinacidiphila epipremni]|uniref:Chromosome partitioning protein n=1 Tax=Actinacidiphila epipremni TaxID=2053013 RepID=A0ABX1A1F4_9ACTN|nr:chromosome partitioning protein [Actinacidiphila epipremni]NJP47744.1 chromosome partitioning protein [Actinacidiphila epipremni]